MRRVLLSTVLAIILASAATLSAQSRPALSGAVAGIELCAQFMCGFALFVGQFSGELNGRDATGGFAAAITHDPLPALGGAADVTGGEFTITANRRVLSGDVADGTIYNIGGDRFCVELELTITDGGRGGLYFTGLLDHNRFPPTIGGIVTQQPVSCQVFLSSLPQ